MLEYCVITGLHGKQTYEMFFDDNNLVVIGENGTGKSTITSLLFSVLGNKFYRLHNINFEEIIVKFTDQKPIKIKKLDAMKSKGKSKDPIPEELMFHIARVHEQEPDTDREYLTYRLDAETRFSMDSIRRGIETYFGYGQLSKEQNAMIKKALGRIIFLPTYRRIEHDIRNGRSRDYSINEFDRIYVEESKTENQLKRESMELFDFGMNDIVRMIKSKTKEIKDTFNFKLEKLSGKYLSDLLDGKMQISDKDMKLINQSDIQQLLIRIEDRILNMDQKSSIMAQVSNLTQKESFSGEEKMVGYYLKLLLDLNSQRERDEKDVREFVDIINRYLYNKTMTYNETEYKIEISSRQDGKEIDFESLSSGEKQLISLFAILYFEAKRNFIMIDEPELSLSMEWQKRLLPDLENTKRCSGIFAVTHSPFIFDNEFMKYTHDIEGMIK